MRLTLKLKLGLAFATVIILSAAVLLLAINSLRSMEQSFVLAVEGKVGRIKIADDIFAHALRLSGNENELILLSDVASIEQLAGKMEEEIVEIRADGKNLLGLSEEAGKPLVIEFLAHFEEYVQEFAVLRRLAAQNLDDQAFAHSNGKAAEFKQAMLQDIESTIEENRKALDAAVADNTALYWNSLMLLGGLTVASLLIATLSAGAIILGIGRSVRGASTLAEAVASGDLNLRVEARSRDELGDLVVTLNSMSERLRHIVGEVAGSARNVAAGSEEMSAAAEQLSQGATEQAASTEEASASMEEMASTIRQSADNAGQTERIARQSAADAVASGDAVAQAVEAMRTIAGKILVVQEIARQTDLLALNAAVEAARAGEHGRGFAVVASEVRKLAERSQSAATEISTLSADTVKAASSAGEMLARLVPDIQRTAVLVGEISAASREQNTGATQINAAIQQLDKVTQQNTSAAEQMAATSMELSQQADRLQKAVGFFRMEAAQIAAAPITLQAHAARHEAMERSAPGRTGSAPQTTAMSRHASRIRQELTGAPHMRAAVQAKGGFALDLDGGGDALDDEFDRRRSA